MKNIALLNYFSDDIYKRHPKTLCPIRAQSEIANRSVGILAINSSFARGTRRPHRATS
ncbi:MULTISPECIES: hypothetical protein [unclassified Janthinobacterium]|uniref:hypothetical protein n=1 Tax=unclassified Janthinobacterium TaxID=2610881 RepID=UPI000AA7EF47|nr:MULTISPECIES: hypothetical protein [unclassified Janthinobacterium]